MEWFIKAKQDSKYPDIFTYDIMEKNPDVGKSGVVYSGDSFFICSTDHKPSADLIVAAPDMYEALKETVKLITVARQYFPKSIKKGDKFQLENTCACINKALSKAEGK